MDYLNFDLEIVRTETGYRAKVLDSPSGAAAVDFVLPFSDVEAENFILRMGMSRGVVRGADSPQMEAAKAFGGQLYRAIFAEDVQNCLSGSLAVATQAGNGLRIRLRLSEAVELADLPWEYLFNPSANRFLSLSISTPLVRVIDLAGALAPLDVQPPLRVLVVVSGPTDLPALDVEKEWERLRAALGELSQRGAVEVVRLEQPTLAALQSALRRSTFHILHFIGHGFFDARAGDGVLAFADETGRARMIRGMELGTLLFDEKSLRLVVLNACEGARTSAESPFGGVAQSLLQQGVPAVIAMQFAISDRAAITFSSELYAALADGYAVDGAVAEARKAIFSHGEGVEWGTPVLYMRAGDGRIFRLAPGAVSGQIGESARQKFSTPVSPTGTGDGGPPMTFTGTGDGHHPASFAGTGDGGGQRRRLLTVGGVGGGILLFLIVLIWLWPRIRGGLALAPTPTVAPTATFAPTPTKDSAASLPATPTPAPTAMPTPVGGSPQGGPVYRFLFTPDELSWNEDPNTWQVVAVESGQRVWQGNAWTGEVIAADAPAVVKDEMLSWSDYEISFQLRIVQPGNPNDDLSDVWITLRAQPQKQTGCRGYDFYLDVGWQQVAVAPVAGENCAWNYLQQSNFPVEANLWYDVRISAVGDHLQLWLNDLPLIDVRDSRSAQGFFYLSVGTGALVQFRDIQVYRP